MFVVESISTGKGIEPFFWASASAMFGNGPAVTAMNLPVSRYWSFNVLAQEVPLPVRVT